MNRLRERTDLVSEAKWRLAAAYALAGQKETAVKLVTNISTEVGNYYDSQYYKSPLLSPYLISSRLPRNGLPHTTNPAHFFHHHILANFFLLKYLISPEELIFLETDKGHNC